MNIKTKLQVIAALVVVLAPSALAAQDAGDAVIQRVAAWLSPVADVTCTTPALAADPAASDPLFAEDFYCDDGQCGDCCGCCRNHDVWGSVEFLMWWAKGTSLPPLVTTSPVGTPIAQAGVLGQPGTTILFGDELAGQKVQAGGRVAMGIWMDPDHNVAAGGRFFALGGDSTRFSANSSNTPIIGRPFFNPNPPIVDQDAELISYPGLISGAISAQLTNKNTLGAEAFMTIMMQRDCNRRLDLLAGYQFLRLDDNLHIHSVQNVTGVGTFDVIDSFIARNQFHGGEFGLKGKLSRGNWALDCLAKVGIGNMLQQVTINGTTTATGLIGLPVTVPTGFLARPSNIGTFERNKFAFVPELTTNLQYYVSRNLSFHIGYNLIWVSDVALSADQIDFTVNPLQPFAGPARPAFAFHDRDYWLQGINFGMNWDY
jgi:hypothetical protein